MRHDPIGASLASGGFVWLTGIEDTFILAPHPVTGRTLDEYELLGHYDRWRSDLDLASQLGVRAMRYGVPWHRINPAPGVWDFSWADRPLEHLLQLGIQPVVDLVHYGVPRWIEGAFLNPDYDRRVAEYAARVAERFRGRINAYTPLNEPRITAWYAGRLGWWPPFRHGWSGFLQVLLGVCRGIVATESALRSIVPDLVSVHVDAADLYASATPELVELSAEAQRRQFVGFLALDLVTGRVDADHPLFDWMLGHGANRAELTSFKQRKACPDVIGINLYPLFSQKVLCRQSGRLRLRMPYASPNIVERLLELYHARYSKPLMISETASKGSVSRRLAWLEGSVAAVELARRRGIPVIGYTWWPMFSLVGWAYRQGKRPAGAYLQHMGLWDVQQSARGELDRVPTPLVAAYHQLASGAPGRLTPVMPARQPAVCHQME